MPPLPPLADLPPPPARKGARVLPAGSGGINAPDQAPTFRIAPARLWRIWLEVMADEPRTRLEVRDDANLRSLHVQRSRVFGFPDEIRAEVIALGRNASGIAIDSRARLGVYDFGVNARRARHLVGQLHARAGSDRRQT